jgi:acetyltransferase
MMTSSKDLDFFFAPKGVVVVGVSSQPQKLGYGIARSLTDSGYKGAIYFVNPKGGMLLERNIYPDIGDVPDPVDLAVLLVPAQYVLESIEACGRRGIPAAIVSSGGFREVGEKGARLENELLRIAQKYSMRLMGPNCIGILDKHFPLDTTFLPPPGPNPGEIAFISQSGAICAAVSDWSVGQGFGFSRLISLGNQVDINETDVLIPIVDDEHTKVVTYYLEAISAGRRFVHEARKATRQKPVIALKVGRSEGGQAAVASHTGALAGQESAYTAAFRRSGVLRAHTTAEMFAWAKALAWCPLPKGPRVAVVTNAGGPGVTATDALEERGLELAQIGEKSLQKLMELHPPAASLHNPIDMLASASPELYAASLKIVLEDPGVDSVLVILPPPPMYTTAAVAAALIPVIELAEKPVVVSVMGDRLIQEAVERFRAAQVPEYRFPEEAADALYALNLRRKYLDRGEEDLLEFTDVQFSQVEKWLQDGETDAQGFLKANAVHRIMQAYKLPVVQLRLARSAEEAVEIAEEAGYPVVLKVASSEILHKSEAGGILLNMKSVTDVRDGYVTLIERMKEITPSAKLEGVYVQKMIAGGQEVVIGAVQDSQFGSMVMFGSGGTEVEGLKDVAFALSPLTMSDAKYLLDTTWAGQKLAGFRNLESADRQAVIDALGRMAQLANDHPQIKEMEINPLLVMAESKGAFGVDVRMRILTEESQTSI